MTLSPVDMPIGGAAADHSRPGRPFLNRIGRQRRQAVATKTRRAGRGVVKRRILQSIIGRGMGVQRPIGVGRCFPREAGSCSAGSRARDPNRSSTPRRSSIPAECGVGVPRDPENVHIVIVVAVAIPNKLLPGFFHAGGRLLARSAARRARQEDVVLADELDGQLVRVGRACWSTGKVLRGRRPSDAEVRLATFRPASGPSGRRRRTTIARWSTSNPLSHAS